MTHQQLVTDRLLLRRWEERDLAPFAELNADPEVTRYLRGTLDREASDALVARTEQSFEELGYGLFAVEVRDTGAFAGFTGLARQTFEAPFNPSVEVGWRFARWAWGHGYATEAARAALGHAFGELGLLEVVSMTAAANERSQAVMRRLGMTRDPADDYEQAHFPSGHPLRPAVLHRLSRERWAAARAT